MSMFKWCIESGNLERIKLLCCSRMTRCSFNATVSTYQLDRYTQSIIFCIRAAPQRYWLYPQLTHCLMLQHYYFLVKSLQLSSGYIHAAPLRHLRYPQWIHYLLMQHCQTPFRQLQQYWRTSVAPSTIAPVGFLSSADWQWIIVRHYQIGIK